MNKKEKIYRSLLGKLSNKKEEEKTMLGEKYPSMTNAIGLLDPPKKGTQKTDKDIFEELPDLDSEDVQEVHQLNDSLSNLISKTERLSEGDPLEQSAYYSNLYQSLIDADEFLKDASDSKISYYINSLLDELSYAYVIDMSPEQKSFIPEYMANDMKRRFKGNKEESE